jgi:hypothetical protein
MPEENVEATEEVAEVTGTTDQHGSAVPEGFSEAFNEVMSDSTDEVSEDTDDTVVDESVEAEFEEEVTDGEIAEVETTESEDVSEEIEEEVVQEPVKAVEPIEEVVEYEEIDFELDEDLVDPTVKAAFEKLKDQVNKQQKSIDESKSRLKIEQEKVFENRIDSCFDKYVDDLPNLGETSKLSEKNGLYRRRIFQHAQVTAQMDNISIEDAIKDAVQMHKNRGGEQATKKKLITSLNKQKKKFTNPPTRKNKSIDSRKFATEQDRARAIMDKAYVDAGIN